MAKDDRISHRCGDCALALREARPWLRLIVATGLAVLVAAAWWDPSHSVQSREAVGLRAAAPRVAGAFDHSHKTWSAVLARYVHDGRVDYRGLDREGRPALDGYLQALQAAAPQEPAWTRQQRLAYWINAYNAYTVRLILDHYPVESIRSIGLLPGAAFRTRFIPLGVDRRHGLSLDDIEHGILRKRFQDARVHFAIVCASKSCPSLRSEAYRSGDLDDQLDDAARRFLQDPRKNWFAPDTNTLYLSSIFKWFGEDFERDGGTLQAYVARYWEGSVATQLRSPRVVFQEYDWSLNGR